MRKVSSIASVVVLVAGAVLAPVEPGVAAGAPPGRPAVQALLDVPYLAQTPALCGGAAVAMVLRYWGERDVFPEDFAPLVTARAGGIFTGTLTTAIRDRNWHALVVSAAADAARARIQSEIDLGRPLIALIEVGPETYHYVVVVGLTDQEVVLHDPARAPFRVLRWTEFDRAWMAAGRWMLLVLPPAGFRPDAEAAHPAPPSSKLARDERETPCAALVERGVDLAIAGDREEAERQLIAATRLCPAMPAAWRELAGLRFSESRWPEARDLALSAVRLAPDDAYAWQLVATTRYLTGDGIGALEAWNRAGEPRIDAIAVHGAGRTRQPVVVRASAWRPRQLLTPEAFGRARRRLQALPVASAARVTYEPLDGGRARIDVFLDERQVVPRGWVAVAGLGARAAVLHELRVDVAGALGEGELASAAWRWSAERPRVALGLALPSPPWLVGVLSLEGSWERQAYVVAPALRAVPLVREHRRRLGLTVADWSANWWRWQAGGAFDRFGQGESEALDATHRGVREHLALEGALEARLAGDRLALTAVAGWWVPVARGTRFGAWNLRAAWRSTTEVTRPSWSAVAGVGVASRAAPLALWPGAGTGQGRPALLRAHPLLGDGGTVTGAAFGRTAAHGSLEYARPIRQTLAGGVSIAAFVDTARAGRRLSGLDASPLYVDAGVGMRVGVPGSGGEIRIDVAHGLRGGGSVLSAGWRHAWPR